MVLMTWLYVSALIFLIKGEVNAVIEHASAEGKAKGAHAPGEAPQPAQSRPNVGAAKQSQAPA